MKLQGAGKVDVPSAAALSIASDAGQDGTTSRDLILLSARNKVATRVLSLPANNAPVPHLPATCLVVYGAFSRTDVYYDPFTGLHWLELLAYKPARTNPVTGKRERAKVIVNDPLFPRGWRDGVNPQIGGAYREYDLAEFEAAHRAINGYRWAICYESVYKQSMAVKLAGARKWAAGLNQLVNEALVNTRVSPKSEDPGIY
jgi:hypothetical protein